MEINLNLYTAVHLSNGNILLRLKKDIDETQYHLKITDVSFYKACEKNIGKIHIYQPTNVTKRLLEIIIQESIKLKTIDNLLHKMNWIESNITSVELDNQNLEFIKKIKCNIHNYTNDIKRKIEFYSKNNKTKIKITTLVYLFIKIIAELSGHNYGFGEEFFLLKLINQYFPEMKWDYHQIYILETNNDLAMCRENGERYYNLVQRLCIGDKKAFDGKEIEFFPSSFERNKMSISHEIFSCIEDDIYDDGINCKNYDTTDANY